MWGQNKDKKEKKQQDQKEEKYDFGYTMIRLYKLPNKEEYQDEKQHKELIEKIVLPQLIEHGGSFFKTHEDMIRKMRFDAVSQNPYIFVNLEIPLSSIEKYLQGGHYIKKKTPINISQIRSIDLFDDTIQHHHIIKIFNPDFKSHLTNYEMRERGLGSSNT